MSAAEEPPFDAFEATLKRSAAALREADVPFLLGGSLASWARGGPQTRHDLDLMIKREDTERALAALTEAGMRADDPPEEWLVKVWDGDVLVDLIHGPSGLTIDDEAIARGEVLSVLSMEMRVMALEDVMTTKLMALTEHSLRYETLLSIARALREQIDWDAVRAKTEGSPFARAFFVLAEGLEIVPERAPPGCAGTRRAARQGRHTGRFGARIGRVIATPDGSQHSRTPAPPGRGAPGARPRPVRLPQPRPERVRRRARARDRDPLGAQRCGPAGGAGRGARPRRQAGAARGSRARTRHARGVRHRRRRHAGRRRVRVLAGRAVRGHPPARTRSRRAPWSSSGP